MEPYPSVHINKSVTASRSQLHIFHSYVWHDTCNINREFKKLLRRRRRQRRLKLNLHFTYESRGTLKLFTLFITIKAMTELNLGYRNKFEIEI